MLFGMRSLRHRGYSSSLHGHDGLPRVYDNLLVQPLFGVAPLDPLPCRDAAVVQIEVENPDLAVESTIAAVPAEARSASVTHPEGRLLGSLIGGQGAILIRMITGRRNS